MKKNLLTPWLYIVLVTAFLLACGKPAEQNDAALPANILSEEAFSRLLVDFALAESAINVNVYNIPVSRMDTIYAFNPLNDNHVRKAQYDSTLAFYAAHPELYKKVYEAALAALSQMQGRRDSLSAKTVSKDSVLK